MAKTKQPKSKEEFQKEVSQLNHQIEEDERAEQDAKTQSEEEVVEDENKRQKSLINYIVEHSELTHDDIENWKEVFSNKVFATIFDEDEFYVYRHITRPEMKQLRKGMSDMATYDQEDEAIFRKAILYPEVTTELMAYIGSGTVRTLAYQVRIASNDIPESLAIEMIQKI